MTVSIIDFAFPIFFMSTRFSEFTEITHFKIKSSFESHTHTHTHV